MQESDRLAGVTRALKMIEIVSGGPPEGFGLTFLAHEIGISKSSALALLRTLSDAGFVRAKLPGPKYLPGVTLIRLGDQFHTTQPIDKIASHFIYPLAHETGLAVRVAINDDGRPVFIARADAPGTIRFHTRLGVREAPHTSSAGKAILAQLPDAEIRSLVTPEMLTSGTSGTKKSHRKMSSFMADIELIRDRKYAIDDEEDVEGIFCIGAAFFDHQGQCAGAISATGIKTAAREKSFAHLGGLMVKNAQAITKILERESRYGT
jgi:IclR family acetate operon transcriptional repressor